MKTGLQIGIACLLFFTAGNVFSQCEQPNWPEDGEKKATAQLKLALLQDNKTGNPRLAVSGGLNWFIKNIPDFHYSIYLDGAEAFTALANAEKDPAKKQMLVDSLALMYDLRLQHTACGQETAIAERKALALYGFLIRSKKAEDFKRLLKVFDEAVEKGGKDLLDVSLIPYWTTIYFNKKGFDYPDNEQILDKYDRLIEIFEAKIQEAKTNNKPVDDLTKNKDKVESELFDIVKLDCDLVKSTMIPRFKENPKEISLAKRIFRAMLKGDCIDDPNWLVAGEAIIKDALENNTPVSVKIPVVLASKFLSERNYEKASSLADAAMKMANDNEEKGEVYLLYGDIENKKGSKSAARNYFQKAISAGNKEGYTKIGNLYMNSVSDCAKKESQAEDRLIFIAAYEMYQKAGNTSLMSKAKAQFPSTEELFEKNWKVGETKKIECWVGESVVLATRPK